MIIAAWIAVMLAGVAATVWNQRKANSHRAHGDSAAFANRTALTMLIVFILILLPALLLLQAMGIQLDRGL